MEEKKLTEKESLELISQMIRNTQTKMEENSGTMFLIWGYTTIGVTLLVWLLLTLTHDYSWQWLWFLLPAVGSILSVLHVKKEARKPHANTYIDRIVWYIWMVLGTTGFVLSVVSIISYKFPILFVIVLIMGMGTTLTGLVIRFKAHVFSGILGMVASVAFLFVNWQTQMLMFSAVFLVMMVIPGYILNYTARKRNK